MSGRAGVEIRRPLARPAGGRASGRAEVSVTVPLARRSGAKSAGRALFVIGHLCGTWGGRCIGLPASELEQTCLFTGHTRADNWLRYPTEPGQDYRFTLTVTEGSVFTWDLREGTSCDTLVNIASGGSSTPFVEIEFTANWFNVYVVLHENLLFPSEGTTRLEPI